MDRRQLLQAGAGSLALAACGGAAAQGYPAGPITVILPLQAGSASDVAVRSFSERMGAVVGAPLVVENVTGAAGLIGLERLSKARPDGQTLAALNNSIMTILPHLQPGKMKGDMRTDFIPIAGIANIPTFLGVKRGSPLKTVKDVVAFAKANPDKLMYSSGGVGSPQHLATEMFASYSGIKLSHIPYKGASQAALGLASGEVDVMMIALSLALPFLGDGRVELVGYCGPARHPQFGDLKTLQEQGVKDYDYSSWIALFAPKDTPAAVVETLRKQAAGVTGDRGLHTQLIRSGMEPWERDARQLQRAVEEDHRRWERIVKTAKIQGA